MTIDIRKLFSDLEDLDKKMVDAMVRALKSNHLKEFDYLKFKHSVNSLQELNMDEITSYKSAYMTAATLGLTKDKLAKTARHYKSVLEKERSEFGAALKNQMEQKVSNKSEQVEQLKTKIENINKKIAQLQKEAEMYQKKIDNMDSEVEKAKQKIQTTKENFVAVLEKFINQIDEDIDKIDQYL